jgi:hypothetical protein
MGRAPPTTADGASSRASQPTRSGRTVEGGMHRRIGRRLCGLLGRPGPWCQRPYRWRRRRKPVPFSRPGPTRSPGNEVSNTILGQAGNDTIGGGAGDDNMYGGKGKHDAGYGGAVRTSARGSRSGRAASSSKTESDGPSEQRNRPPSGPVPFWVVPFARFLHLSVWNTVGCEEFILGRCSVLRRISYFASISRSRTNRKRWRTTWASRLSAIGPCAQHRARRRRSP